MTPVSATVNDAGEHLELTILMPCLNEAETLAVCIRQAREFLDSHHVNGEVLVADNGSDDGSQQIAITEGARLVRISERGYGAALIGGIAAARGTFVAMADADDSYDFGTLGPFLDRLRVGDDLVMGNRFLGGISPGAMPALHRYLGNPVLSLVGRVLFRAPVRDFHCGLRAFRREGGDILPRHIRPAQHFERGHLLGERLHPERLDAGQHRHGRREDGARQCLHRLCRVMPLAFHGVDALGRD